MAQALYLDTSAVLRATLEAGTTPELDARIRNAEVLLTSRLSLVESARALARVRHLSSVSELQLMDAEREMAAIWDRCHVWELTRSVCNAAQVLAPTKSLRTLDALHLATFLAARRKIEGMELLTADQRLAEAARWI